MDELPERVTLWRCACCGKWSFAKRRPMHHKRTIRELVDDWGLPFEEATGPGSGVWFADREDGRTRSDPRAQAADWELPELEFEEGHDYQVVVTNRHGDPEPDFQYSPATCVVKCGPFVEYTAYLRAQWHQDSRAREHAAALSAEAADDSRAVAASGDVDGPDLTSAPYGGFQF